MNVFLVERNEENLDWSEDYAMVVVAENADDAIQIAKDKSEDFRDEELIVRQVDTTKRQTILVANTGA